MNWKVTNILSTSCATCSTLQPAYDNCTRACSTQSRFYDKVSLGDSSNQMTSVGFPCYRTQAITYVDHIIFIMIIL